MIIGIVAISQDHAIGRDGKLPWHYSSDLKFFKRTTVGNAVLMGANTWRTLRGPLPDRLNIVMTRTGGVEPGDGVVRLSTTREAVELSHYLAGDLFVIGGAATYAAFADVIDKWIVTEIPITVADADTYMPSDFLAGFDTVETVDLEDGLVVKVLRRRQD